MGFVDLQVQAAGLVGGVGVGAIAPGAGPVLQGGFQHVLPGPGGGGVAQGDGLSGSQGPHGIGHDPMGDPVVGADHVAGAVGIVAALPQGALAIHIDGHAGQGVGQLLPGQPRQHPGVGAQGIAVEAGGASCLALLEAAGLELLDAPVQIDRPTAGAVR